MCLRLNDSTKKQCNGSQNESVMVTIISNVFYGDISALSNPLLFFRYAVPRLKRTQFHGPKLREIVKESQLL